MSEVYPFSRLDIAVADNPVRFASSDIDIFC